MKKILYMPRCKYYMNGDKGDYALGATPIKIEADLIIEKDIKQFKSEGTYHEEDWEDSRTYDMSDGKYHCEWYIEEAEQEDGLTMQGEINMVAGMLEKEIKKRGLTLDEYSKKLLNGAVEMLRDAQDTVDNYL